MNAKKQEDKTKQDKKMGKKKTKKIRRKGLETAMAKCNPNALLLCSQS